MGELQNGFQSRRVRVYTTRGVIDGSLRISPMLRSLDELNVVSRHFVTLHEPDTSGVPWTFSGKNEIAVNRSSILFLYELSNPPRTSGRNVGGTFTRAAVRLAVEDYRIEGFLHVPPGGAAMKRLNQSNHPFLSLTSVSAVGPDTQFAAAFLAVNQRHILAGQEIEQAPEPKGEPEMSIELTS